MKTIKNTHLFPKKKIPLLRKATLKNHFYEDLYDMFRNPGDHAIFHNLDVHDLKQFQPLAILNTVLYEDESIFWCDITACPFIQPELANCLIHHERFRVWAEARLDRIIEDLTHSQYWVVNELIRLHYERDL